VPLLPRTLRKLIRPDVADQQDFLDQAADLGGDRVGRYRTMVAYYEGDHDTRLTDRTKMYLERHHGIRFCENFCEPVVDVYAERLCATGFQTQLAEEAEDTPQPDQWMQDVAEANRFDALQSRTYLQAIVKGDAFVLLDRDPLEPAAPRLVFNRPDIIRCEYSDDNPDELAWASKRWNSTLQGKAVTRLNVYWPDRVEKWFRLHKGGQQGEGRGGWTPWPQDPVVPWLDAAGEPLGVPVFHFRHRQLDGWYGRSELRGVIPQVSLLNKQVIDLAMVLDNYGEPSRWATGVVADNADPGHAAGEWFIISNETAKVGQFDIADASQLVAAIENTISRIARRSRTPLHLLTGGDMPSGEALKSAEAGLVAKVENLQVPFGNVWEDALRMAMRLAQADGALGFDPEGLRIETQWDDPASRNEREQAEAAVLKHELGVSKATLIAELGYDPEEEAERRRVEQEEAAAVMGEMLDRGDFDQQGQDANGGGT
jgi:hypothetical protein